jgi:hypothetical protein
MATFITDRTESDISASKQFIQLVGNTLWGDLTAEQKGRYLNEDIAYEDKGRFGKASASRIRSYLVELTGRYPTAVPWGAKTFYGIYDDTVPTPTYFPIKREDFEAWIDVLSVMYGGDPIGWDFNTKPYLNYELLNRMEFLSQAIYDNRVSVETELTGAFDCGEEFIIFDQSLTA